MVLIATIGGLIALTGWGFSDYFAGKAGQKGHVATTFFVIQFIGFVMLLPIILWYGIPFALDTSLLLVIASAASFTIAYLSFIKAMSIGPFGVAAPIGNSYPLITLLLVFIFFSIQLAMLQLLALLTITAGVIMLAVDSTTFVRKKMRGSAVLFALVAMVFWGLAFALIEPLLETFTWYQLLFLLSVFTGLFSLIFYRITHKTLPSWDTMKYRNIPYAWNAGLLGVIGAVAFFIASDYIGSVVIPAVIASASPLVTSVMAYARDGERLSLYKRLGAVIVVLGLVLLNLA